MNIPPTLRKLWELTGIDPETCEERGINTTVGLILHYPLENGGYENTPVNSVMFARTGGDGVHFSLFLNNGEVLESSPVVMTVPMSDTWNTIVGSDLREFLALGCRFGYCFLDELTYEYFKTMASLKSGEYHEIFGDAQRAFLDKLASTFQLRPWPDPERRLDELQEQYAQLIELPDS